jgi:hypothetical protein
MGVECSMHVADEKCILVGKPAGTRPLGRTTCRWKDIKMDLEETGWTASCSEQSPGVGSCVHSNDPLSSTTGG